MATAPFPVQAELTAVAVRYTNGDYIADRVAPRLPVGTQEFKYLKHNLAEGFTIPDTLVGRRSMPNEVEFTAEEATASTNDYGLDDIIPNADIQNAPPNFNPLARATEGVTDLVMLDREYRVASAVFASATYNSNNRTTLSGSSQWSHADADPVAAILAALDGMVMRPNIAVLGQATWTKLRQHAKVIKAVFGPNLEGGLVAPQQLAQVLELDEILVGKAFRNSAKRGQTTTMARVWGKHAAFLRRETNPSGPNKMPTFMWTAQFGQRVAGSMNEPKIGLRGSVRVRAGESVKEVVSANDLGYLFIDAVA